MVSKSDRYHLVIEEFDKLNNKHIELLDLKSYLDDNESILFYAFIKHDSDINQDGEVERVHYHIVLILKNQYSKNTIINDIACKLEVNKNIISCRKMFNIVLSVQYLVHQNDKDKYQYDLLEVYTNDTSEFMNCIVNSISSYDINIDYLITLVKCSDNIGTIYKEIGLKKARTYRSIIMDLWHCRDSL